MEIRRERLTDAHEGELTLFVIGMRINQLHRVDLWRPVASAMPAMLRELAKHPEFGLIGWEALRSGLRTVLFLQYWRNFDGLHSYAHDPRFTHLPAWKAFNRAMKSGSPAVGIFHETYVVPPGGHETIYFNMPDFGLARAIGQAPATGSRAEAKDRLTHSGATRPD